MTVALWLCYYPMDPDRIGDWLAGAVRSGYDVTLHQRVPMLPPEYMREAAPNKMFTEEQRSTVRFLRFAEPVPCCACGKLKKTHWTSTVPFRAVIWPKHFGLVLTPSRTIHIGLAPICRDHLMAAAYFDEPEEEHETAASVL